MQEPKVATTSSLLFCCKNKTSLSHSLLCKKNNKSDELKPANVEKWLKYWIHKIGRFFFVSFRTLWQRFLAPKRNQTKEIKVWNLIFVHYVYCKYKMYCWVIINFGVTPHCSSVLSIYQLLWPKVYILYQTTFPKHFSNSWQKEPCKTTFRTTQAPHYTSTPLSDKWWHSNCRSFLPH